jgi:hypothetical protein
VKQRSKNRIMVGKSVSNVGVLSGREIDDPLIQPSTGGAEADVAVLDTIRPPL